MTLRVQVLVIAPGFGLRANPQRKKCIEKAGFTVVTCPARDPGDLNFDMSASIKEVLDAIKRENPHALLCASRGGEYLVELWHAHDVKIPSVMINAHPACLKLPKDTSIVIAQGSEEEVWPKERGYTVQKVGALFEYLAI
jgi:hypothetical protein